MPSTLAAVACVRDVLVGNAGDRAFDIAIEDSDNSVNHYGACTVAEAAAARRSVW
jgi:hypothetical protein